MRAQKSGDGERPAHSVTVNLSNVRGSPTIIVQPPPEPPRPAVSWAKVWGGIAAAARWLGQWWRGR